MFDTHKPYVSIIVTLYKDLEALTAVLRSLQEQTYRNFEVIIAEDDNSKKTLETLTNFTNIKITHVSHPDTGNYKVVIQNEAIRQSQGEYLIFLDGDCVLFHNFIEYHLEMATHKKVLCGRRVNLGEKLTYKIKKGILSAASLEFNILYYVVPMIFDKVDHLDEIISFHPKNPLFRFYTWIRQKKQTRLLGCHFSCFKKDFLNINGFDEGYDTHPLAHDTDLDWRFRASGCELISCKNSANMFHLFHGLRESKGKRRKELSPIETIMEERKQTNSFFCKQGVTIQMAKK